MLDVEHFAGLEKWGSIVAVEIQSHSAAAEVVGVGLGFCRLVCFEAVFGPELEDVPVAADTESGY